MKTRHTFALLLMVVCGAPVSAATYRTKNFRVEAPTDELTRQVGRAAERYRKEKAVQWLGKEMPAWDEPCDLRVTVNVGPVCGATTFDFDNDRGGVRSQTMRVEGPLDQILYCVLPHEVTHTVFANHFGRPVPRWADEGGASLSETAADRTRYDGLIRQYVREPGRVIPLGRLFEMSTYPPDVLGFYTESYSVSNFLVNRKGRADFLLFLSDGLKKGWDRAVWAHYGYRDVNGLEEAWLSELGRGPQRQLLPFAPDAEPRSGNSDGGRTSGRQPLPGPLPGGWDGRRQP